MTQFINNLRMRYKFALIGALALMMVILPTWRTIATGLTELDVARAESAGMEPAANTLKLIQLTQQHRALSALVLSGDAGTNERRQAKQQDIEQALAKVQLSVRTYADPKLDARLATIQRDWQVLNSAVADKSIVGPWWPQA